VNERIFVNSAHVVKNTLLQTAFSTILPAGWKRPIVGINSPTRECFPFLLSQLIAGWRTTPFFSSQLTYLTNRITQAI